MFFNAHAYYSMQRSGSAEPLRIFGALLPDSALTGVLEWGSLHQKDTIQEFSTRLTERDALLGLGIIDHYELDMRSHDAYNGGAGYAFSRQTPQLRALVAQASGLASADKARGIAHNFIEAGVDINLLRHDASVQQNLRAALQAVDISAVAEHLASFFKLETAETTTKLVAFRELMLRYDLATIEGWTELWTEIISLLLHNQADTQATTAALGLAVKYTAQDYLQVASP